MSKYLFQPAIHVNGSTRFVLNGIVEYLFQNSGLLIDKLLDMEFSFADKIQFMQLLGMDVEEFRDIAEKKWPIFIDDTLRVVCVADRIADGKGVLESRIEMLEEDDSSSRDREADIYRDVEKLSDEIARLWQAFHDRNDR